MRRSWLIFLGLTRKDGISDCVGVLISIGCRELAAQYSVIKVENDAIKAIYSRSGPVLLLTLVPSS